MGKYQRPKGTHDLYPFAQDWVEDSVRWNVVEDLFRKVARLYGYGEVRTPLFETTDLFTRSIGDGTDIVNKEMYTFLDKSDRSMTLRPEGTAGVLRAYLDAGLANTGGVTKLYYIGPMFRYERPQKGRYRQHQQCGVEALGSDDPALDAEVIGMALAFFTAAGLTNLTVKINSVGSPESRAAYLGALKAFVEPHLAEFSEEGKTRFETNPLRMLDTKSERELEILAGAPSLPDYLTDSERAHFESVLGYLSDAGYAHTVDPHLVRGFDYYTLTAFEVQSGDLGAQNAVGGGGRYNKLVEELGGKPTPGIGFGLGFDRMLMALQQLGVDIPLPPGPDVYLVADGDAARGEAIRLAAQLRARGIAVDVDYNKRSVKAQMRAADGARAKSAVFLDDAAIESGTAQVRDMAAAKQTPVALAELAQVLGKR